MKNTQNTTGKSESTPRDVYQEVTNRIITALEKGTPPWRKPWRTGQRQSVAGIPCNAFTDRAYSGVNIMLLWLAAEERGYSSDRWLTYKQALEAGGHVRTGESASQAVLFKPFQVQAEDKDGTPLVDETGKPLMVERAYIKSLALFNIEQCDGLPVNVSGASATASAERDNGGVNTETFNRVMDIVRGTQVNIIHASQDRAFYRSSTDSITLPTARQFFTEADYWSTLLHELVHATGHVKRLNREGITAHSRRFGDEVYAFEELIAETGSAFLCASLGIYGDVQHESYLASWLKVLKEDKHAIFRACRQAREASEFLLNADLVRQVA